MEMVPIVYVSDAARSADFFDKLGAELGPAGINPFWTEMKLGGRRFALHGHDIEGGPDDGGGRLGLSLVVDEPLEVVRDRLAQADVVVRRDIEHEPFGRSMVIEDPDGLAIQVNEHDPERHADW